MNDKIKEKLLDQSCAPTDNLQTNWDRIDWTKAEQAVKKLQARIVKAQKDADPLFLRKSLSRKESYF